MKNTKHGFRSNFKFWGGWYNIGRKARLLVASVGFGLSSVAWGWMLGSSIPERDGSQIAPQLSSGCWEWLWSHCCQGVPTFDLICRRFKLLLFHSESLSQCLEMEFYFCSNDTCQNWEC